MEDRMKREGSSIHNSLFSILGYPHLPPARRAQHLSRHSPRVVGGEVHEHIRYGVRFAAGVTRERGCHHAGFYAVRPDIVIPLQNPFFCL